MSVDVVYVAIAKEHGKRRIVGVSDSRIGALDIIAKHGGWSLGRLFVTDRGEVRACGDVGTPEKVVGRIREYEVQR